MTIHTMSDLERRDVFDERLDPDLYAGVRTRRSMAFILDCFLITLLMIVAAVAVFVLGLLTFGLGWHLYFVLWPAVAILYYAFSYGGGGSGTPGMQAMGLEMRLWYGPRVDPLLGVAHAVFFYLSMTFLTPFVLLFTVLSPRKRLLHDLLLGTVVVDRGAARRVARERLATL